MPSILSDSNSSGIKPGTVHACAWRSVTASRRRPLGARALPCRPCFCQARCMTEHHRHAPGHSPHPEESPSPAEHSEQRYCEADRVWSGKASATMTSIVCESPPAPAIDLACGEGGDVLWLAEQGWPAHGLDISTVAIDRARSEAVARGLERATFTAADLSTWRPEPDSVELVTAAFFQSHVALDRI